MRELSECRREIDRIDSEIQRLFEERMRVVADVADYKKAHNLPVNDPVREQARIEALRAGAADESLADGIEAVYRTIFAVSKDRETVRIEA
ncbi:MAG: chorismate mutase [Lachnospiraceae bacterium]|nr:chorismate mutase [Lachnospiraceae bacterium]